MDLPSSPGCSGSDDVTLMTTDEDMHKLQSTQIASVTQLPNLVMMRMSCNSTNLHIQQVSNSIQIGHIHLEQHFIGYS